MNNNKTDNIIKDIVETGSEISGGIGGTVIGGLIVGPMGTIIGGVCGPIITKAFKVIGAEIKKRILGSREEIRIGAAYTFAIEKINENESKGLQIRNDDFFEEKEGKRPASEEILEGIIISAQREYEEQKVRFLGYLYANICTDTAVSKEMANQLIRTANLLSFQQFCMLQLLDQKRINNLNLDFKLRSLDKWEVRQFDVVSELKDLEQRGLIFITKRKDDIYEDLTAIKLYNLNLTKSGEYFCKMLYLKEIDARDLNRINEITTIIH